MSLLLSEVRSNFLKQKPSDGSIPMSGDLEADTVAWIEVGALLRGDIHHRGP